MITKQQALEALEYWTRQAVWAYRNLKWPDDKQDVEYVESQCAYWAWRARQLGAGPKEFEKTNNMLRNVI
jgi:hypothetical protein